MKNANPRAVSGDNNPPAPWEDAVSRWHDDIEETSNWLDGTTVENDDQLASVEALRAAMRDARLHVERAEKSASAPLHDAWKAEKAQWKPTLDDLALREKGLIACMDVFKRAKAADQQRREQEAMMAAYRAKNDAQAAIRTARPLSDIEAQQEVQRAQETARLAMEDAARVASQSVKGLRTVTRHELIDARAGLHWIAANDRAAVMAFVEDYARRHHESMPDYVVRTWKEKVTA